MVTCTNPLEIDMWRNNFKGSPKIKINEVIALQMKIKIKGNGTCTCIIDKSVCKTYIF